MSSSFFDRLTGSMRGGDDGGVQEPPKPVVVAAKTKRPYGQGRKTAFVSNRGVRDESEEKFVNSEEAPDSSPPLEASSFSEEASGVRYAEVSAEPEDDEKEGQLMLDVYDGGAHLDVYAAVAGARPEDIDISVVGDLLTIKGFRRSAHEENDSRYHTKELYWGGFMRSINLPDEVDGERIEALIKNGLLTVRIPKKSGQTVKKIRVKSE